MDAVDRELLREEAQIAKALAHESRLVIVDALKDGDMCVHDLTQLVGADQSTVSKHLSILKNVGIVDYRKESKKVFYHLRTRSVMSFFHCAVDVIRSRSPARER